MRPPKKQDKHDTRPNDSALRYSERKLLQISSLNRQACESFILAKKSIGSKPKTIMTATYAVWMLDRLAAGKPIRNLAPDELRGVIASFAATHSASTTATFCAFLTSFYNWAYDGEPPKSLKMALRFRTSKQLPSVTPLSEDEFRALLQIAHERPTQREAIRQKAFLWLLWDTGFRLSELLVLRIGDVSFASDDSAKIVLPKDAPRLKTGPRTIYITESVPMLRLWLSFHPNRDEKDAPLITNRDGGWLHIKCAQCLLASLGKRAGIERNIHAHLFRHSRATRAARAGWKEAQLRAFFGWGPTSPMPAHYVHLAESDMMERVRSDAKADPLGALVKEDPRQALGDIIASTITALDKAGRLRAG